MSTGPSHPLVQRCPRGRARRAGMTLLEAMLSIVLLGLTASGISALYVTGLQSLQESDTRMLLDGQLRSQMELLVAQPFETLQTTGSGSSSVTVDSRTYTASWTATSYDVDGNGTADPTALLIVVTLEGSSLSLLRVDGAERVLWVP